jgi:hypothetical protein
VVGEEGARKEEAINGDKYWTGAETQGDPTPLIKIRPANASVLHVRAEHLEAGLKRAEAKR